MLFFGLNTGDLVYTSKTASSATKAASPSNRPSTWFPEVSEASEVSSSDDDNVMPPKISLATFWPNNAAVWFVRAEEEWVHLHSGNQVWLLGPSFVRGGVHEGGQQLIGDDLKQLLKV